MNHDPLDGISPEEFARLQAEHEAHRAQVLRCIERECDYLVAEGFAYYSRCPTTGERLITMYTPEQLQANLDLI